MSGVLRVSPTSERAPEHAVCHRLRGGAEEHEQSTPMHARTDTPKRTLPFTGRQTLQEDCSSEQRAAVHLVDVPGDERGHRAEQVDAARGDLLRTPETVEERSRADRRLLLRRGGARAIVSVGPGETALTRTPCGLASRASDFVSAITPPFAAA